MGLSHLDLQSSFSPAAVRIKAVWFRPLASHGASGHPDRFPVLRLHLAHRDDAPEMGGGVSLPPAVSHFGSPKAATE